MSKICQDFFPLSSQVLPCLFWGRCQIPRLGVSCSSGAAFRALFFFLPFFGGDAKSLAWVFLARRVLPFVLGFFCCLFWGRCQIPRLGVSCSSGAAFRVWFFLLYLGAAKSIASVFLTRRVLTKWMVMGSVYLELFQTKPCSILACPIIPYVLWNTIL